MDHRCVMGECEKSSCLVMISKFRCGMLSADAPQRGPRNDEDKHRATFQIKLSKTKFEEATKKIG